MNGMKVIVVGGKKATQGPVALLARQGTEAVATSGESKSMLAAPEPRLTIDENYVHDRFQYIRQKMREGLSNDEDC
ncbi:MAG: hypothetical protein IIB13_05530 [Chloroflexi bacterium]|nr:hypothetical protein [Chloroflexota bacterium]